jgi:hypothetical protein
LKISRKSLHQSRKVFNKALWKSEDSGFRMSVMKGVQAAVSICFFFAKLISTATGQCQPPRCHQSKRVGYFVGELSHTEVCVQVHYRDWLHMRLRLCRGYTKAEHLQRSLSSSSENRNSKGGWINSETARSELPLYGK